MKKIKKILILGMSLAIINQINVFAEENIEPTEVVAIEENENKEEKPIGPGFVDGIEETLEYVEVVSNIESNTEIIEIKTETEEVPQVTNNRMNISDKDYQNLLRIVEAEATGLDLRAKRLVANVIINRSKVGTWGNTITSVIYAKGQFSPLSDGRFWRVTPNDITIQAVEEALNGIDDSQGALYFMNPRISSRKSVSWFNRNLTYLFEYEGHQFFK